MQYIEYPKCTTCKKAKKYLIDNGVNFNERNIVEDVPSKEELKTWVEVSGLPLKRFFNTSGLKYKELELAKRFPELEEEELFDLLASNGMLIKRPLLIGEGFAIPGFKESEYEKHI